MKKGRGRVTKSFCTWDKHKGKVTEGFHTISRTKKRLSKEENVVENLELPIFTGGFQVENLRWRVQNLLFPSAADMVDQGNQLKRVWECRKWSKSAIKVLKKVTSCRKKNPSRKNPATYIEERHWINQLPGHTGPSTMHIRYVCPYIWESYPPCTLHARVSCIMELVHGINFVSFGIAGVQDDVHMTD